MIRNVFYMTFRKLKVIFSLCLCSLVTLMFINMKKYLPVECESYLIFVAFQILFPTASLIFTAGKLFHK